MNLNDQDEYSILILGIAGGAGYVYEGHCSSSFLLLKGEKPVCLIDLGLGVTRTLTQYGYSLPDTVIITHNHTDHAGELPVVIRVEESKGRRLNIAAATPVSERLKHQRMAEHNDLYPAETLANWLSLPPNERSDLTDDLQIQFIEAKHSEKCFGFKLFLKGIDTPLLGYTGDSGFYPSLYQQISQCSVSIFDARPNGNEWHAGIDELEAYQRTSYIIGHGMIGLDSEDERLLQSGQRVTIRVGEPK
ncbi:MBL fold metallo-hydrolase [Neptuniibacter caesariensis]|uniref:Metallo-beta-lactamase family protein n=1 Tax=Neptuniibacter caesariensis TaxID=207954 RepID=A0A7U8C449_NEPCE|nr:MBL fold metallo-hydrolase [Neptuniibacter caesariensis]EAR59569.1 metallo-beta-lactamase family protein [Oceanospirillum sp. MED92] [Neptuniibacter caesariensis]